VDEARVDQWLWAVRLYKTRSMATAGVRGGHVKINHAAAKPASRVKVGDRIEATIHDAPRDVEVVRVITKRVGAPVAAQSYVDHSPPVPAEQRLPRLFPREAGTGRPTKRDRRRLDRLRGD
jgi:ribosome-associated heat shock protein Hsp15